MNSVNDKEFTKIPNRLRKYGKIRGLSQRRVAAILGVKSASRISNWENGRSIPNLRDVIRLSILYRTLIDGLFIEHVRTLREEIRANEENWSMKITPMKSGLFYPGALVRDVRACLDE